MSTEVECSCGHRWATRKPIAEIDQLRCSECGTADENDLTVQTEDEHDETPAPQPDIIDEVEAEARQQDLFERVDRLMLRCESTDLPDE